MMSSTSTHKGQDEARDHDHGYFSYRPNRSLGHGLKDLREESPTRHKHELNSSSKPSTPTHSSRVMRLRPRKLARGVTAPEPHIVQRQQTPRTSIQLTTLTSPSRSSQSEKDTPDGSGETILTERPQGHPFFEDGNYVEVGPLTPPVEHTRYISQMIIANESKRPSIYSRDSEPVGQDARSSRSSRRSSKYKRNSLITISERPTISGEHHSVPRTIDPTTREESNEPKVLEGFKLHQWKAALLGHWIEIKLGHKARHPTEKLMKNNLLDANSGLLVSQVQDVSMVDSNQQTSGHPLRTVRSASSTDQSKEDTLSAKLGMSRSHLKRFTLERLSEHVRMRRQASRVYHQENSRFKESGSLARILRNRATQLFDRQLVGSRMNNERQSTSHENLLRTVNSSLPSRNPHLPYVGYSTHHTGSSSTEEWSDKSPDSSKPNTSPPYSNAGLEKYLKAGTLQSDSPSLLPTEADRVGTPHSATSSESPWSDSHSKSSYFNTKTHELPEDMDLVRASRTRPSKQVDPVLGVERNWFRMRADEIEGLHEQDLQVPDHLPSSPLCPRHPKHRSAGQGACVVHGRAGSSMDSTTGE